MESCCFRTAAVAAAATVVVQMIQGKKRTVNRDILCANAIVWQSLGWSLLIEWLENILFNASQSETIETTGIRNVWQ